MKDPKIIVALDYASVPLALELVNVLDPGLCRLKVGKELFTYGGPALIESLHTRGFEVFLDLKFHDIPATTGKACAAAVQLGVWMVNVHAGGGRKMLESARAAVPARSCTRLIAVTVLTSMEASDLAEVGVDSPPAQQVQRLAGLAADCGLDGVVCSPLEVKMLKQQLGEAFLCVTPGVRPAGAALDDQQRVNTPEQALRDGSDYLVIGRPITQAEDPLQALKIINQNIYAAE